MMPTQKRIPNSVHFDPEMPEMPGINHIRPDAEPKTL